MSLCCDYRVQSETGTFGLNEVQLGIPVPKYWAKLFVSTAVDARSAELALHRGTLLTPLEARALGLINEICPHAALVAAAERAMETLLKLPDGARAATKLNIRGDFSREWEAFIEEEARDGWGCCAATRWRAHSGRDRQTVVAEQKDGRWRTRKGGGRGETGEGIIREMGRSPDARMGGVEVGRIASVTYGHVFW